MSELIYRIVFDNVGFERIASAIGCGGFDGQKGKTISYLTDDEEKRLSSIFKWYNQGSPFDECKNTGVKI